MFPAGDAGADTGRGAVGGGGRWGAAAALQPDHAGHRLAEEPAHAGLEAGDPSCAVLPASGGVAAAPARQHNLIGNALKYSVQGTPIAMDVQTQEQRAVITVRDQGVGIPAEDLTRIFTRFFRASTAAGVKGTGIGLAGSKAILEQHHGQITIESAVGQGTTVRVHLPRSTGEGSRL